MSTFCTFDFNFSLLKEYKTVCMCLFSLFNSFYLEGHPTMKIGPRLENIPPKKEEHKRTQQI